MHSRRQLRSLSALVLVALLVVSLLGTFAGTSVQAACKVKTDSPSIITPVPTSEDDSVGEDDEDNATEAPLKTKTPTTAPTTVPEPIPSTTKPAPVPSRSEDKPQVTPSPAANTTTTRPSGGKCVTGDPTQYISKVYVDWIWEKRIKPEFKSKNFIFDQLMANNGKLSYCIRWDSTNKLPKAIASKFQAMLQRQYDQWNKWLVDYDCWPFKKIELEMVGVSVHDKNLLDWSDDSLGPIYEKLLDHDGIPMCPVACYKHREGEAVSSDTSACKGKPFDMSFWPTLNLSGGTGYDWGQRVEEAALLANLDSGSMVIVAHEIGHGFGLPDFYEPGDKPGADMPKLIMDAGASMSVTEGDGWILRRAWEYTRRARYSSSTT